MTTTSQKASLAVDTSSIVSFTVTKPTKKSNVGISLEQPLFSDSICVLSISESGLFSNSGFTEGQRVLSINGMPCPKDAFEAAQLIAETSAALSIEVGNVKKVTVKLEKPTKGTKVGISLGKDRDTGAIMIRSMSEDSLLRSTTDLKVGQMILSINGSTSNWMDAASAARIIAETVGVLSIEAADLENDDMSESSSIVSSNKGEGTLRTDPIPEEVKRVQEVSGKKMEQEDAARQIEEAPKEDPQESGETQETSVSDCGIKEDSKIFCAMEMDEEEGEDEVLSERLEAKERNRFDTEDSVTCDTTETRAKSAEKVVGTKESQNTFGSVNLGGVSASADGIGSEELKQESVTEPASELRNPDESALEKNSRTFARPSTIGILATVVAGAVVVALVSGRSSSSRAKTIS